MKSASGVNKVLIDSLLSVEDPKYKKETRLVALLIDDSIPAGSTWNILGKLGIATLPTIGAISQAQLNKLSVGGVYFKREKLLVYGSLAKLKTIAAKLGIASQDTTSITNIVTEATSKLQDPKHVAYVNRTAKAVIHSIKEQRELQVTSEVRSSIEDLARLDITVLVEDSDNVNSSLSSYADFIGTKFVNWALNESGFEEEILENITHRLVYNKKTKKYTKQRLKTTKVVKKVVPVTIRTFTQANTSRLRATSGRFQSVASLQALINLSLHDVIKENMGSPALNYRTGRFAHSAKVTGIQYDNRTNALTAFLTYMRYPYQTFEPGFAQGSIDRDPRPLITKSVRELAVKLTAARLSKVVV